MTSGSASDQGGASDGTGGGGNPTGQSTDGDADGRPTSSDVDGESADGSGRTVSVLGVDVVIEEDFLAFPWRAGIRRAPIAFAVIFVLTLLVAAIGGFGEGTLADRLSLLGIVVYNAHNVHAATGYVPELFAAAVDGGAAAWRPIRGLFVVGPGHGAPLTHLLDILGGETAEIGHLNFIERQTGTDVPSIVYYLLPPLVLLATGYEYALRYWDDAATDSPLEVVRFGLAMGVGYVLLLLVGTVVLTVEMASPLAGTVYVLPDRYMTVLFGFGYPAVFGTLGAGLVYLHREVLPENE